MLRPCGSQLKAAASGGHIPPGTARRPLRYNWLVADMRPDPIGAADIISVAYWPRASSSRRRMPGRPRLEKKRGRRLLRLMLDWPARGSWETPAQAGNCRAGHGRPLGAGTGK